MPMNTSNFPALLFPQLKEVFGLNYKSYNLQFPKVFDTETSDKYTELRQEVGAFGLFQVKPQGQNSALDQGGQGFQTALTNIIYSLGFEVTHELVEDDQYGVIRRYPKELAVSAQQTKDVVAQNILNNGFDTNYPGADGLPLFSTAHIVALTNGTYANRPASGSSLSETALRFARTTISNLVDSKGKKIMVQGRKLIVPPNLVFTARKLLKSTYEAETANNAINPTGPGQGELPEGIVELNFLSSDVAWFIRTDAPGLIYQNREENRFMEEMQVRALVKQFFSYYRCAFGWYDPRSAYGNPGL